MNISCDKCQAKFKIPDEKIPKGKTVSVPCPKCKQKISVSLPDDPPPSPTQAEPPKANPEKPAQPESNLPDTSSEGYNASERAFDFIEEGTITAMLCESDENIKVPVRSALDAMEYKTFEPNTPRDALKQMRYQDFDVVILNERFGTRDPDMNHVLKYLGQLPMILRRNIFVTLISDRFRTMDSMITFNKSVNLIINTENIKDFNKIFKKGLLDNDMFYKIYKEGVVRMAKR